MERPRTGKDTYTRQQKSFKGHARNKNGRMTWKVVNLLLSFLIRRHRSPYFK